MKILIVGSDLNTLLLAKYLKIQSKVNDIYVTTETECHDKSYVPVMIKENDIEAICDFVKYNQIEMTISMSCLAIINGIADLFEKEGFPIVAPFSDAARITFFNSIAKKVMYKLKIPTPRFGIFDRENIAADYIRKVKFPIIIMNDFTINEKIYNVYKTYRQARVALQKFFENGNDKIIIENYIEAKPITIYFLTDGYNAIPLISVEKKESEKFSQIIAPCNKVNNSIIRNILKSAIYPLLDDIVKQGGNYSGILGLKIIFKDNNFYVLEYYNAFQEYDMQIFLSLLNYDLTQLFYETSRKQLNNIGYVEMGEKSSYTLVINKEDVISDINDEDYFVTEDEKNIIITKTASTINYAKENLEEYLATICKKETFEKIIKENKEVLRI